MKDKQAPASQGAYGIPILSPLLHHLAMPAIVFWRSQFGFSYLGRKRIFFSCIWACALLSYIVWHTPDLKSRYGHLSVFFCLSATLYLFHLTTSFRSELRRSATHDQDSGKSHLLRFLAKSPLGNECSQHFVQAIVEPLLTALAGLVLTLSSKSENLGSFLIFAAACLAAKEAINAWLTLRRGKRHSDLRHDIVDEYPEPESHPLPVGSSTRQPKSKRQRDATTGTGSDQEERKHAQTLRLLPPYTLATAIENYRALIKEVHPDLHSGGPDATGNTQDLNEAIEYFRTRLGN